MNELKLKYGCNNNQIPARLFLENNKPLPIKVLNGNPGYINFLDALNGWQLVSELKLATNCPAAASFKHCSPAGAAIGINFDNVLQSACMVNDLNLTSKIAIAYAKARGADRMSSYGDWAALSDECDLQTATILKREVSDGIIAPSFSEEALQILKTKKRGTYNIVQIDSNFKPEKTETRQVFGITFEQKRNDIIIDNNTFKNIVTKNKNINKSDIINLIVATITIKYTQSNSICFAHNAMATGIGAGQQSRIDCTKIAGQKAVNFALRTHPKIRNLNFFETIKRPEKDNLIVDLIRNGKNSEIFLNDNWKHFFKLKPETLTEQDRQTWLEKFGEMCLSSDGFFPFSDCVKMATKFNAKIIAQPGGSIRDSEIIDECNKLNLVMALTKTRLFFH